MELPLASCHHSIASNSFSHASIRRGPLLLHLGNRSTRSLPPPESFKSKKINPGIFEVVDEETGKKMIVWGVDDDEPPVLTPQDFNWKPAKRVVPGDISEESWMRAVKAADKARDMTDNGYITTGRADVLSEDKSGLISPKGHIATSQKSDLATRGLFSKLKVQSIMTRTSKSESQISGGNTREKFYKAMKQKVPEGSTRGNRHSSLEMAGSNSLLRSKSNGAKQTDQSIFKSMHSEDFFSIKSFRDLGASDVIIQALASMQVKRPSQIQAMAYQCVFQGRSCIIAEQTGSGKTLAYLAPLVQRLSEEENRGISKPLPNMPRILIVVPTSELAAQVLNVCRSLSKGGSALKSIVATGGFKLKTQLESLEDGPDVLIATPGRLIQLLDLRTQLLDRTLSVVIDEVDILFDDEEFSDALKRIEESVSLKVQYIHVTATLPVDVHSRLLERHPESTPLMGPGLHCTATGLQEVLVDCSGEGEKTPEIAFENKRTALVQLVEQHHAFKTIIFCNKIETCRKVENVLKRIDRSGSKMSVLPYHAALSQEARLDSMQQFADPQSRKPLFLVCTDRASRGLDLAGVEHVILFDFPRDPSEYVRRVGRTARAGGGGKAFVFVVGKQVALARRTMARNDKGHPIHTVPSS